MPAPQQIPRQSRKVLSELSFRVGVSETWRWGDVGERAIATPCPHGIRQRSPPKLSLAQTDTQVQRATEQARYLRELDQALHERHREAPPVNPQTLARALKARGLRVHRTRWSLKKNATPPLSSAPARASPASITPPAPERCD
ncbi:hypothetical protein EV699_12815 [Plasticicumulans lactativorans]|uniref:Uncharacterized protein n=2 Tax=Plasticicumulans lactativorans TaxID=1133106 RepID=A0A4R2KST8_9GAMM|nr:hypothetical protein EV699_12815 [Plasticicumulans lactativorans]